MDGLFVILFGPLILKIVSPLDPHSLIARRNPVFWYKNRLSRYGYFHYKYKTVIRPSYLYNVNSCTWKMTSLCSDPDILFLAATKQLYKWYFPSVRLSVRPSVCHTFFTMFPSSYHHEIFRSYYQWQQWRPCRWSRSKVKVTEVTTQLNCFRTVTPVWIHIWWWNDAYSLIMLRRGALLFFKVIGQISRSHGSKNCRFWPRLGVSGL